MFINVFFSNFVAIPQWKDIFRMSICCYSVMKSGQFHCKRIVEQGAHAFVSYICSYIYLMRHGLLSITFARAVQSLITVVFNSSHAFSIYALFTLKILYLWADSANYKYEEKSFLCYLFILCYSFNKLLK